MTDPFFKTASNSNQDTKSLQEDNIKKIDEMQRKQKQLEQEFLKLNDYLKNNVLTNEQKASIEQQMQQLDFQYKQNASTLKSLWVWQSSVKVNTQEKSWSKISMRQFLVWCGVILFLLVWWLAAIFYYLVGNPAQMSSVGITPQTAKTLLQTFVVIFFGFLFLLGFALVIVNTYRLITVKNKSKTWYTMWTILWLIVFIFAITFGSVLLSRIGNISVGDLSDPNKLIRPSLILKDWPIYILSDPNLKLIAPWIISFDINTNLFDSQILPQLWQVQIEWIQLDCGNGQKLDIDMKTAKFNWSCIYYSKWKHPLNLLVSYINSQTSEKLQKNFEAWDLNFESEIKISNKDNSIQNIPLDVIVWKVPSKVTFDASEVFKDFSLNDYAVVWDVDWDWTPDKTNDVSFTYVYKEAKVYHIWIRFPNLNKYLYTFPIRVEQSDVPICEVLLNPIKWTQYNIKTNFLDASIWITDYQFDIFDYQKWKIIDNIKSKKWYIDYTLPSKWTYSVIVNFVTEEWKPGQCESDDIEIWQMDFDILYDIYYKSPQSPNFVKIDQKQSDMFEDWYLIIKEIPTILRLDITKITPDTPSLTKSVLLNSKPILSSDNKSFQITLDENKDYEIKIIIQDINRDVKSERIISVKIERDDVIWKLLITPDTVGMDPFTVQLDASTTIVNDSSDEIVYFTRDFGDGEIKKNFSQSIVSHTYRYDNKNENWEYFPKVTIKTKKWREIVIWSGTRIIVKKALVNLEINIDSHPAQTAKIWDKVDFSVEMNWLPKTMRWDFGDWNDVECKARECMTASKVYNKAWIYTVRVFVTFDNQPDLEGNITVKVQ